MDKCLKVFTIDFLIRYQNRITSRLRASNPKITIYDHKKNQPKYKVKEEKTTIVEKPFGKPYALSYPKFVPLVETLRATSLQF